MADEQQQDHRRTSPLPSLSLRPPISFLMCSLFSPAHLSLLSQLPDAMPRPPTVVLRASVAFLLDPPPEHHFPSDPARFGRSSPTARPQAHTRPPLRPRRQDLEEVRPQRRDGKGAATAASWWRCGGHGASWRRS
uniref:Uncharacterized protein n=1 Tax=Triticum urartu TaxID=4572 RepID=A0A8R7JXB6_TRIUA